MSKTITLTEHRPADGLLTMRVRNTTYNVNIFFNPKSKNTLDQAAGNLPERGHPQQQGQRFHPSGAAEYAPLL